MGKVVLSFTMSLDGFIAGPNVGEQEPMGEGGEQLHQWLFDKTSEVDQEMANDIFSRVGAVILGRRTFDLGLEHWEDTPFPAPSFVLTHETREPMQMKSATFTFTADGVESVVEQAKVAAAGKDVVVMGANVAQQLLKAGQVDEIVLQIAPVLLGRGIRLFDRIGSQQIDLKRTAVIESPLVTHLHFQVL